MSDDERALELAYRELGRRDRTEVQLRRYLDGKDLAAAAIDAAVATLVEQGYVDDARYARAYAEDRRALDGWGGERIECKLLAAGVDADIVAAVVGARTVQDELEAAVDVLRGRWRGRPPPASARERERALALLVRRGFDLELAYDAVRAFERAASTTT